MTEEKDLNARVEPTAAAGSADPAATAAGAQEEQAQPENVQPAGTAPEEAEAGAAKQTGPDAGMSEMLQQLQLELQQAREEAEEYKDGALRAAAEMANMRKRTDAELEKERKFAAERFVKAIAPVLDSMDQALQVKVEEDGPAKAILDGVQNTLSILEKELGKIGVEIISPLGQKFDPHLHQALSMIPNPNVPDKQVIAVMQRGMVLNGRLVRPAMVMVAKNPVMTPPSDNDAKFEV